MFFSWLRYILLILILLIPTSAVDDVVSTIESITWRYAVRLLLLFIALFVIRLIPPPVQQP